MHLRCMSAASHPSRRATLWLAVVIPGHRDCMPDGAQGDMCLRYKSIAARPSQARHLRRLVFVILRKPSAVAESSGFSMFVQCRDCARQRTYFLCWQRKQAKKPALSTAPRHAGFPAFLATNGDRANSHRCTMLKHALPCFHWSLWYSARPNRAENQEQRQKQTKSAIILRKPSAVAESSWCHQQTLRLRQRDGVCQ